MTFYSALAATSARLLKDKGASATLRRTTYPTFDPGLGEDAAPVLVTQAIVAVFLNTSSGKVKGLDSEADPGTTTRRKLSYILVSSQAPDGTPLTVAPEDGDEVLTPSGETFFLSGVSKIAPDASTNVLYKCAIRV